MTARTTSTAGIAAALATAVLCLLLAAGAVAPPAAASPDATAIDDFLELHESPMVGTGATFVLEGREHGVDPAFLVAVAGAESSFGEYLYSEGGDRATYNAFNWFYGETRAGSDFGSWDEAIARVAEGIAGQLYYGAGLVSVDAIGPRYCTEGTAEWIANVKAFMSELGGDFNDTRIAPGVTPPAPSGAGIVTLDGSVALDHGERRVGQRIYAWFTLTNTGGQPVTLDGVRLAVRGPGDAARDLVYSSPLTIAPGAETEVSASWALDLVGRWRGWVEVTSEGRALLVGDQQAFAFWVRLPRDIEARRMERSVGLSAPL